MHRTNDSIGEEESEMKYMVTFPMSSETFKERAARFLETGGKPPEGVTMLGRWHGIDMSQGFVLAESDSPRAVYKWISMWADLIDFEIVPVIEDEEAASVLQELDL
jgi:hypothetical protein